ncbi:hypothetical protein QLX67_02345 [Balneolaceae bacterium ANBcel3]|nr:hypothetical protein [Balneolaceae bacterium ANBcel3]
MHRTQWKLPLFVGIILALTVACSSSESLTSENGSASEALTMPAVFSEGRIFLEAVTTDHDTLRFFTDSAESTLIYQASVESLGLVTSSIHINGQVQQVAFLPTSLDDTSLPPPLISDGLIPVRPDHRKPPHHEDILGEADGILGVTWFADRIWTIDYVREELILNPSYPEISERNNDSTTPLHFRKEGDERAYHFARLDAIVAKDTLSLILKTGGSIVLSDPALTQLNAPKKHIPAGLISESMYQKWVSENPDWIIYEEADRYYGSDIIEVPSVRFGSYLATNVRFAVRRDEVFEDWFSAFTDKPVSGALGPDAFQHTRITIDYPNSLLIIHE